MDVLAGGGSLLSKCGRGFLHYEVGAFLPLAPGSDRGLDTATQDVCGIDSVSEFRSSGFVMSSLGALDS